MNYSVGGVIKLWGKCKLEQKNYWSLEKKLIRALELLRSHIEILERWLTYLVVLHVENLCNDGILEFVLWKVTHLIHNACREKEDDQNITQLSWKIQLQLVKLMLGFVIEDVKLKVICAVDMLSMLCCFAICRDWTILQIGLAGSQALLELITVNHL